MKKALLCIGILILSLSNITIVQAQKSGETTIILIRHAEKIDDSRDPALSAKGTERALALLDVLQFTEVDAIYSTDYTRTKDTVKPLSEDKGVEISLYDPRSKDFITDIYNNNKGKTVVVSGHSNTTPTALNVLTKSSKYPNMGHDEYSSLYIVFLANGNATRVVKLKYGE